MKFENLDDALKEFTRLVSLVEINPENDFHRENLISFFRDTISKIALERETLLKELGILNDTILTLEREKNGDY